jgi:hypothetical protein
MLMGPPGRRDRLSTGLSWLVGICAFSYLMAFPRVLNGADESFVLYGASRILRGQAIYKDFFEFVTPGSFYFFAGIFAITGPSLLAARAAMAIVNTLSCVLLFKLVRQVASAVEACIAVALFVVLCLPVWPIASPHWLSTALCLATATVLLREHWQNATRARAALVGGLVGLTFCVQQHRGVFLSIWVAVAITALAMLTPQEMRWRRWRRELVCVVVSGLGVVVAVLGYTAWRASLRAMQSSLFAFVVSNYFPAVHGSSVTGHTSWAGSTPLTKALLSLTWVGMFKCFPAVLVLETIALAWVLRRNRGRAQVVRGCCVLLAITMSAAILYSPDFIHVAFVAPFFLVAAARLAHGIRTMSFWARVRPLQYAPLLALMLVLALAVNKGRTNLQDAWRRAPRRFETAIGTLYGDAYMPQVLQAVRFVLKRSPSRHKLLFSYPSDAWLYLTVPADNPTPFDLLYRGFNSEEQFHDAIAALRARPPDCIVVNTLFGSVDRDPVLQSIVKGYQLASRLAGHEIYAPNSRSGDEHL